MPPFAISTDNKQAYADYAMSVMNSKTYDYEGNPITFHRGDNIMVSATEMAKPFGKRPNDFLSAKSTQELICSLSAKTGISATELVVVNQGGNNQGTWLHEDLALIFAQWLSPTFYLWCNDRIKELMQVGMTATPTTLEAMLGNPDLVIGMATQLKQLRAENEEKRRRIETDAPKVLFADAVIGSKSTCLIGELAKILTQNGYKIGQNRLFKWLREHGYLGTKGEYYNIPNQSYQEMGLFEVKTSVHDENGVMVTKRTPKVTGKGQQYFVNKFLGNATSEARPRT